MAPVPGTSTQAPPRVALKHVDHVLTELAVELPDRRLDRTRMPGACDAHYSRLVYSALQYLQLVTDDGDASPMLRKLLEAPGDAGTWRAIFRHAFPAPADWFENGGKSNADLDAWLAERGVSPSQVASARGFVRNLAERSGLDKDRVAPTAPGSQPASARRGPPPDRATIQHHLRQEMLELIQTLRRRADRAEQDELAMEFARLAVMQAHWLRDELERDL